MFTSRVDLGQIIIASLIAVVGYLIRNEITSFKLRLDKHDEMLIQLVGDVQRLIGINTAAWNNKERRSK